MQQPQVTLDTTALENTFGIVGQSMLQLAKAQDQTNCYPTRTPSTRTDQYASTYRGPSATGHFNLPEKL